MASPIIPPRRGEDITQAGRGSVRLHEYFESLTRDVNIVSGEVSEASELVSSSGDGAELIEELEVDLAFITPADDMSAELIDEIEVDLSFVIPAPDRETEVISASAAFTTTGSQIIICTNTAAITITLNDNPDDGEQVHIVRQNTGAVTVSGDINGDTSLTIGQRYSSPHLVFTIDAGEWSII